MSQTVLTKQNPSPVTTRRSPLKNSESENTSRNRRSISGKFRSLFRKNSASPTRSNTNVGRTPTASTRQRSPSPEPAHSPTEAPHLRAPVVNWPFGKKKTKLSGTTSEKMTKKDKKKSTPTMEISTPVYDQEYQTSIRGQNFVPRTPELNHGSTGRTQSISSSTNYETKGFRDYMVIDNKKSTEQVKYSHFHFL